MSGTGVNAALTALLAAFTPAVPAGWDVIDSQPKDPKRRFLAVGWDASDQPSVVVPQRTLQNATGTRVQEAVEVSNLLSLWSGRQVTADARAEVFSVLDSLDAALAANRRLGGAALVAQISNYEFTPARHPEGVMAQIRFTVAITTVL